MLIAKAKRPKNMVRYLSLLALLGISINFFIPIAGAAETATGTDVQKTVMAPPTVKQQDPPGIQKKVAKAQVPFIANEGQIKDPSVRFYANTFGGALFVTDEGALVYSLPAAEKDDKGYGKRYNDRTFEEIKKAKPKKGWVISEKLLGAIKPNI